MQAFQWECRHVSVSLRLSSQGGAFTPTGVWAEFTSRLGMFSSLFLSPLPPVLPHRWTQPFHPFGCWLGVLRLGAPPLNPRGLWVPRGGSYLAGAVGPPFPLRGWPSQSPVNSGSPVTVPTSSLYGGMRGLSFPCVSVGSRF